MHVERSQESPVPLVCFQALGCFRSSLCLSLYLFCACLWGIDSSINQYVEVLLEEHTTPSSMKHLWMCLCSRNILQTLFFQIQSLVLIWFSFKSYCVTIHQIEMLLELTDIPNKIRFLPIRKWKRVINLSTPTAFLFIYFKLYHMTTCCFRNCDILSVIPGAFNNSILNKFMKIFLVNYFLLCKWKFWLHFI